MDLGALNQLLQKQRIIYVFLQGTYESEIPRDLIAEMPQKMKPLLAVADTLSCAESKKAVKELVGFIDSIPSQDVDILQTMLAADYARLFLSIHKAPAHPSESTYRDGAMMQYYRDEVLKRYWSFGVSAKKEFTEPEDHIATELSFMAYLCQKANDALSSGNTEEAKKYIQTQKDFLEMHLAKWVPKLVEDIFENARTPFYKGIAALTGEFIELNISATNDMLNQLN